MAKPNDFDIYCEEILTGKTKVQKVFESENVLAFYHTNPSYETHILIIPKKHFYTLIDAEPEVLSEIMEVAKKILKKMNLNNDHVKLVTGFGKSQNTPHLHFHISSDGKYPNIKLN